MAKKPGSDAPTSLKVYMSLEKETPGALRYQEINEAGVPLKGDADGAVLGTLYVRKAAFKLGKPQRITVTLE